MDVSLVVVLPVSRRGTEIPVSQDRLVIGRNPGCQLRPKSPDVSEWHCEIFRGERWAFARDLGSTNGTFLNGRPLARTPEELHQGDRLRIGPLEFEVRLTNPVSVDEPTPIPGQLRGLSAPDEDAAAALLLSAGRDTTRSTDLDEEDVASTAASHCPNCGMEGEWLAPTIFRGGYAVSRFRCLGGHHWEVRVR